MLALGLAIAAGALYLMASGGGGGSEAGLGPPLSEIDDESRARLERVLREADREGREP
jgi:hypothetical protein